MSENVRDVVWLDVPGTDGLYQASSRGDIRSFRKSKSGRVLSPFKMNSGYLQVWICVPGSKKCKFLVHRLVGLTFAGGYIDGFEINHKNGNKRDNSADNLEWVTKKDNLLHARKTGLTPRRTHWKLTEDEARRIKQLVVSRTISSLAEEFCVSKGCISGIKYGATWVA